MNNIVLPKLSYKVMGALFKVQNELGSSLLEKYYQRAIEEELKTQELSFKREVPVALQYQGKSIGRYFIDFLVEDLIILEVKAQQHYSPKFFKQALSYLVETNKPLAIIVNFKGTNLRFKRIVNSNFKQIDLSEKDNEFE
ncbi:MAG: GxxExxY protein [Candidatus Levybacteria bacterium]|nr:GxxExxY protein [Candidatus Levybacteria bacterium]